LRWRQLSFSPDPSNSRYRKRIEISLATLQIAGSNQNSSEGISRWRSHQIRTVNALRTTIESLESDPDIPADNPDLLVLKRIILRKMAQLQNEPEELLVPGPLPSEAT